MAGSQKLCHSSSICRRIKVHKMAHLNFLTLLITWKGHPDWVNVYKKTWLRFKKDHEWSVTSTIFRFFKENFPKNILRSVCVEKWNHLWKWNSFFDPKRYEYLKQVCVCWKYHGEWLNICGQGWVFSAVKTNSQTLKTDTHTHFSHLHIRFIL